MATLHSCRKRSPSVRRQNEYQWVTEGLPSRPVLEDRWRTEFQMAYGRKRDLQKTLTVIEDDQQPRDEQTKLRSDSKLAQPAQLSCTDRPNSGHGVQMAPTPAIRPQHWNEEVQHSARGEEEQQNQSFGTATLLVKDYEEALSFYRDMLNFKVVDDVALPGGSGERWIIIEPPGRWENRCSGRLLLKRVVSEEEEMVKRLGNQTGGKVALFLFTDNFARDFKLYRERGVEFAEPKPRKAPYGTVIQFKDLYGNLWDLLEPTEENPASVFFKTPNDLKKSTLAKKGKSVGYDAKDFTAPDTPASDDEVMTGLQRRTGQVNPRPSSAKPQRSSAISSIPVFQPQMYHPADAVMKERTEGIPTGGAQSKSSKITPTTKTTSSGPGKSSSAQPKTASTQRSSSAVPTSAERPPFCVYRPRSFNSQVPRTVKCDVYGYPIEKSGEDEAPKKERKPPVVCASIRNRRVLSSKEKAARKAAAEKKIQDQVLKDESSCIPATSSQEVGWVRPNHALSKPALFSAGLAPSGGEKVVTTVSKKPKQKTESKVSESKNNTEQQEAEEALGEGEINMVFEDDLRYDDRVTLRKKTSPSLLPGHNIQTQRYVAVPEASGRGRKPKASCPTRRHDDEVAPPNKFVDPTIVSGGDDANKFPTSSATSAFFVGAAPRGERSQSVGRKKPAPVAPDYHVDDCLHWYD